MAFVNILTHAYIIPLRSKLRGINPGEIKGEEIFDGIERHRVKSLFLTVN